MAADGYIHHNAKLTHSISLSRSPPPCSIKKCASLRSAQLLDKEGFLTDHLAMPGDAWLRSFEKQGEKSSKPKNIYRDDDPKEKEVVFSEVNKVSERSKMAIDVYIHY
tara:strand:- start:245 stop:568 length:324 start_codon:yes stop_codon:yes gene_type:complete